MLGLPFHWNDIFGDHLAINAVTSDAADPISLQPDFKFSAVSLARISGPAAAAPGRAHPALATHPASGTADDMTRIEAAADTSGH